MGMQSTIFYTPSGLDRKTETTREGKKTLDVDSNVSTAREIAQIARVAFGNNAIREICAKRTHLIASSLEPNGYHVKNTNKLLRDDLPIVGGKTGFTLRAGHCLATEFTPGRNVLLIVVLGSPDHFRDTRLVYRQALKEVHKIELPPRRSHPRELASKMN
jgi:D-alanyl-D-alanine carboxypeptidase